MFYIVNLYFYFINYIEDNSNYIEDKIVLWRYLHFVFTITLLIINI